MFQKIKLKTVREFYYLHEGVVFIDYCNVYYHLPHFHIVIVLVPFLFMSILMHFILSSTGFSKASITACIQTIYLCSEEFKIEGDGITLLVAAVVNPE
jgi:hypothetical protein